MTWLRNSVMFCTVAAVLAGCAVSTEEPVGAKTQLIGVATMSEEVSGKPEFYGEDTLRDDNGTELLVTATPGAPTCTGTGGGTVPISGTVRTNGSVDSVEITASIDGGTATRVGLLGPQDFTHDDGRYKTANYTVSVSVPNGTHVVQMCFIQSGSQGRDPKKVCVTISFTVDCEDFCEQQGVFGDLVGNPSLCTGNGPPHVPVHVKGEFGASAALTITGPNQYTHSATLRRAGDSCVYQYNWDTVGNGGAGTYSFHAVGENGRVYDFSAQLRCR